jgi:hypothetical protein
MLHFLLMTFPGLLKNFKILVKNAHCITKSHIAKRGLVVRHLRILASSFSPSGHDTLQIRYATCTYLGAIETVETATYYQ